MPALQSSFRGFFVLKEWDRTFGSVEKLCSPLTKPFLAGLLGLRGFGPGSEQQVAAGAAVSPAVSLQTVQNMGGGGSAETSSWGPGAPVTLAEVTGCHGDESNLLMKRIHLAN